MGIKLASAVEREHDQSETLSIVETVSHAGKTLAVAETATGDLVLCRERERGQKGKDGKRSRENGVERYMKRTSALADFAHAVESGLVA